MREVVELPMLYPEKFVKVGIDPPKGVLFCGPPGTDKTLLARAVANRTDACFIRVIGSELVQKYVGEGARTLLRDMKMADAIFASFDRIKDVIRAFCESWCPTTNTLHIAFGEASLSLWDLHKLGGLPIHGKLHYQKPLARKAKKSTLPKATHNPTGVIKKHEAWASTGAKACSALGVKENHEADTPLDPSRHDYLVSVRSSYLPVRCHNTIIIEPYSPHRFGKQFGFCQDIPGNLKTDIRSGSVDDLLKFWQTCTLSNTQSRLISPARPLDINDHVTTSYMEWWSQVHNPFLEHNVEALISSTHQTPSKRSRLQKEKLSKIEQGENQMLVTTNFSSKDEHHEPSKAQSLQLLPLTNAEQGILEKISGHQGAIAIEDSDSETDQIGNYFAQETSNASSSQENISPHEITKEIVDASKSMPELCAEASHLALPEASKFSANKVIHDCHSKLIMTLWESIQQKIVKTPFDQVSSLTIKVQKVLDVIEGVETVDSSSLRNMVQEYFGQVHKFVDLESSFSSASSKDQNEKLQRFVIRLTNEESFKSKFVEEADGLQAELTKLEEEIDALYHKKDQIKSSLK
ncbi:hypothetical protein QUC31_005939, partial [Theobroma cacao]